MLRKALLNDINRRTLPPLGVTDVMPSCEGALTRASAGLRAYAALRMARPTPTLMDTGAPPTSLEDHRVAFEEICAAIADVAGSLAGRASIQFAAIIPKLFHDEATGVVALRQYWVSLGFSPSVVERYLGEAVNAPPEGLERIARVILNDNNWSEAIKVFGAGNPDPIEWGLGFSSDRDLNPLAIEFATTCRRVGLTPSLYVIASIALLLLKMAAEIASD